MRALSSNGIVSRRPRRLQKSTCPPGPMSSRPFDREHPLTCRRFASSLQKRANTIDFLFGQLASQTRLGSCWPRFPRFPRRLHRDTTSTYTPDDKVPRYPKCHHWIEITLRLVAVLSDSMQASYYNQLRANSATSQKLAEHSTLL
jgi:hypothetical protein